MSNSNSLQNKPLLPFFIRGEVSQRIFNLLSTGIGFVNSFFIITYLSVFNFGLYQLILAFIGVLGAFDLDLFDGVIAVEMRRYFNTEKPSSVRKLFKESLFIRTGIAIIITAIVFLSSGFITKLYGSDISVLIRIASLLLVIKAVQSVEEVFLQSIVSFSYFGLSVIRELVKLIFIVSLIFLHKFTILGVISVHVITEVIAVSFFSLFFFIRKYREVFAGVEPLKGVESPGYLVKDVVQGYGKTFGIRYTMSRVLKSVAPWAVKFFINTEAVAYYVLAVNIISFANDLIPMTGYQSIMAIKADNLAEISRVTKKAIKYSVWVGILFLLGAIFVVPELVLKIFPKYGPALPTFEVMALALPLFGAFKILKSTLFILKEQKILTQRLVNELIITLVGYIILLPTLGVIGTGVVHVLVYLERVSFMYIKLKKQYSQFAIKARELFTFDRNDFIFFTNIHKQILLGLRGFFIKT